MVDVWWGIVERKAPGEYDFAAYSSLFHKIAAAGLQLQAVMSFHAAGSNVGDTCTISLPSWVHDVGRRNADIFFTDRGGVRNPECISVACVDEPVFLGHTPLQVYEAFVRRFCDEFEHLFGVLSSLSCPLHKPFKPWLDLDDYL
jgi:beta-amylase